MSISIKNIIKYNHTVYLLYYRIMNFCLSIVRLFIRVDEKAILFNSFAGRNYDDSPKAIFEEMKKDPRFSDYQFVWAFNKPELYENVDAEKVHTNSFRYFITALKARVWITNSSVERGLKFKNKRTFYLNTWHGTPLKKMGSDLSEDNEAFRTKGSSLRDVFMSQGKYETDIFSRVFKIPREKVLEAGLPRNDILANYTNVDRETIRKTLGVPNNKIVILYCPTFREYQKDDKLDVVMAPPMDLTKWEERLGDKFIILIRAHYEVSKMMNIHENDFVKNMTKYPCLNDLIIASDLLISDYSSVFFDYSITCKPMLHFTYDYDEYSNKRGMYFDIRTKISGASTEDELIRILIDINMQSEKKKSEDFRNHYVDYYGNATKSAINCIYEHIHNYD